ncbi:UDP-glycosyltransferase 91C1-like, partial [Asparagus officinalis]|uniref:UDP-glycosyltransferase 91C1-like n=1 Tax=Asparagus officinalis TaxID=4686 RepID=UPI00098E6EC7
MDDTNNNKTLHIAIFPWLAFGHLIPFLQLSISLANAAADSTADLPTDQTHLLKAAYDLLSSPLRQFLTESSPDWIIYDFAPHWAGPIARELGIKSVMLTTFPAAATAFLGPIEMWADEARKRTWVGPESLTTKPDWIVFDSGVAFNRPEAEMFYPMFFG